MSEESIVVTAQSPVTDSQAAPVTAAVTEEIPATKPKKRRKKKKWLVLVVVLVIAAALVWFGLRFFGNFGSGMQSLSSNYVTGAVTRRDIVSSLSGSGALEPADSYTVTTLISGEILSADFEEGDIVEKDSVLYEVDHSDPSKNIERAGLSLSNAQSSYRRAVENRDKLSVTAKDSGYITNIDVEIGDDVNPGQLLLSIVDSKTMTVEVPFLVSDALNFYVGESASVTLDGTFEILYGSISKISGTDSVLPGNVVARIVTIDVENPGALSPTLSASGSVGIIDCAAPGTFKNKSESVVTAEVQGKVSSIVFKEGDFVNKGQTLITLQSNTLSDQIDSASRSVRDAEIALENANDQLDYYTIESPISGTIIQKDYKAGDTLSSGKLLCTIYDLSYLKFIMYIDELDIKKIEVGQDVSVTADAVEGEVFKGIITKISVQGASSGGVTSYPVTVRIDDMGGLLPGMNVDADIVFSKSENVLSVPIEAVSRGNRVLVKKVPGSEPAESPAENDGTTPASSPVPDGYEYVQVEIGVSDGNFTEIVSGLNEGDEIAFIRETDNGVFMFPGMGGGTVSIDSNAARPAGGRAFGG